MEGYEPRATIVTITLHNLLLQWFCHFLDILDLMMILHFLFIGPGSGVLLSFE